MVRKRCPARAPGAAHPRRRCARHAGDREPPVPGAGASTRRAVRTASARLGGRGFIDVATEVANEHTVGAFRKRPLPWSLDSIPALMEIAHDASGGLPVGCSEASHWVAEARDVVLVHGNGARRQQYHGFIRRVRGWNLGKPIVCNEDSRCFDNLDVALRTLTSWGYYNNHSKQEPRAAWGVANAEELFFGRRLARGLGIPVEELDEEERCVLLGLNDRWSGRAGVGFDSPRRSRPRFEKSSSIGMARWGTWPTRSRSTSTTSAPGRRAARTSGPATTGPQ